MIRAITALVCFVVAVVAQPASWDGWVAVSSFKVSGLPTSTTPYTGNGGIWLLHPRLTDQTPIQVTNLPTSMTGSGNTTAARIGTNSIAWVPRCPLLPDGGLVAGEISPVSTATTTHEVKLHLISLAGTAATPISFTVGNSVGNGAVTPFGSIDQIALVRDDNAIGLRRRILFTVRGVNGNGFSATGGPLLGFLTEYAPSLHPLPMTTTPPGAINALCVSADETTAYFAMVNAPAAGQSQIWSVTLPASLPTTAVLTPALVATLPHYVLSLATQVDGSLLAGLLGPQGPGTQHYARIALPAGSVTYLSGSGSYARNAVAVERFTGSAFAEREAYAPAATTQVMEVMHRAVNGTETRLSEGPTNGWGVVSGIAVMEDPSEFAAGAAFNAPAGFSIGWDLAHPTAGTYTLPRLGNANFSVGIRGSGNIPADGVGFAWLGTVLGDGAPCTAATFECALATGLAAMMMPAAVDPTAAIPLPFTLGAGPVFTISGALPSTPALAGVPVFLQFVYYSPSLNALWLSSGLRIGLLE